MENSFVQRISWTCLLPYNLAKYGAYNQQLKCSSERKISSVPVFKQDPQKPGKCITVIQNILN